MLDPIEDFSDDERHMLAPPPRRNSVKVEISNLLGGIAPPAKPNHSAQLPSSLNGNAFSSFACGSLRHAPQQSQPEAVCVHSEQQVASHKQQQPRSSCIDLSDSPPTNHNKGAIRTLQETNVGDQQTVEDSPLNAHRRRAGRAVKHIASDDDEEMAQPACKPVENPGHASVSTSAPDASLASGHEKQASAATTAAGGKLDILQGPIPAASFYGSKPSSSIVPGIKRTLDQAFGSDAVKRKPSIETSYYKNAFKKLHAGTGPKLPPPRNGTSQRLGSLGNAPLQLTAMRSSQSEGSLEQAASRTPAAAAAVRAPSPLPQPEPEDDVLLKCEQISTTLRQLNSHDSGVLSQSQLVTACGPQSASLKDYQLTGINFLYNIFRNQIGGAILADEMGLGKTAQTISFLGAVKALAGEQRPVLVVVPVSLLENWQRELATWAPGLKVLTFYGADKDALKDELRHWRQQMEEALESGQLKAAPLGVPRKSSKDADDGSGDASDADEDDERLDEEGSESEIIDLEDDNPFDLRDPASGLPPFDLMLTTYTLFERDGPYSVDRAWLSKWGWSVLVMDEAHALKNKSSRRTSKLQRVAHSASMRIMLTGTPLQNDLKELGNLLAFLMPKLFSDEAAELEDVAEDPEKEEMTIERMKKLLEPFILRRMKSDVAKQLVDKEKVVRRVDMTEEQQALYEASLKALRKEVEDAAAGGKKKRTANTGDPESLVARIGAQKINNLFTHLRKISQHPLLVRARYTDEQLSDMARLAASRGLYGGNCTHARVLQEMSGYSDLELHNFAASHPKVLGKYIQPEDAVMCSGKCQALSVLLPELAAAGHRVLIFSQWTSVLDVLGWLLQHLNFVCCRLDGSTPAEERLTLCDKFNAPDSPIFAFLLSTRAGGQGLNLTGADTVILHDVDFNPQIDRQAEDRCHRLGQTKPVTVYRLVTKDTVDQSILEIAERKLKLDAAVLEGVTSTVDGDKAASGKGKTSEETKQMQEILAQLLATKQQNDS